MVQKSLSSHSLGAVDDIRQLAALLREKHALSATSPTLYPNIQRAVDVEIYRMRQKLFEDDFHVDLKLPAPEGEKTTIIEKMFLPSKTHPDVNFVGRIIGPRGMTAKQIEIVTGCKVMIRGKGSMRDGDRAARAPQEHLVEDLHVLLHCVDTPNRAAVRIQKAKELITKISTPGEGGADDIKRKQLMELAILNGTYREKTSPSSSPSSPDSSKMVNPVTPSSSGYRSQGSRSPENLSPLSSYGVTPYTPSITTREVATWLHNELGIPTPSPSCRTADRIFSFEFPTY